MADVIFTNVRILDGSGTPAYPGSVWVKGNRIDQVVRGRLPATIDAMVIDGAGATLMPGMTEAHTHFSWNNASSFDDIQIMPPEEHTLWTAGVAGTYLDHGWTSCVGAAAAKPRLEVVVRNAINSGMIPGPRFLAASQEITVPGSLGDDLPPHLPFADYNFGAIVSGPDEMRRCVRMFCKYGVDSIKLNLSGDNFVAGADAKTTWMGDDEVAMAVSEAKIRGKRVSVHARSCASVKQALRHGAEVIYHASYTDSESLDLLEAHRDRIFVAPGLSVIIQLLYHGEVVGIDHKTAVGMGYEEELAAAAESLTAMHRRGVRVLPGGDYGFSWAPHGTNAMDLQYFVKYLGMSPMEAIISATKYGGQIMMQPDLGEIRAGALADLLLVDGDPVADLSILLDTDCLLAIMKDGIFHKQPQFQGAAAALWQRTAA